MTQHICLAAGDTPPVYQATGPKHARNDRPTWEWVWLAGILVFSLVARLVYLDRAPPGVRFDELVNVKMADHIYAGEWPIYFQEAWGHDHRDHGQQYNGGYQKERSQTDFLRSGNHSLIP